MLEDCSQLFGNDLFKGVHRDIYLNRFPILVDYSSFLDRSEDWFVHRHLNHDASVGPILPRQPRSYRESLLTAWMRIPLDIALRGDLDGRILGQHTFSSGTRFLDKDLHSVSGRGAVQPGEVQVFGEAIVAEVALSECGTTLEDQLAAESRYLVDTGQNPGQEVVAFEHLPGNAEPLASFL